MADEIRNKQSDFLQLLPSLYKQRLMQADTQVLYDWQDAEKKFADDHMPRYK